MRQFILIFALLLPSLALASGGGVHLMHADNDLSDTASLQRGAKLFVNYCLSCHSAKYMRFSRIGKDLGLTDEQLKENLMFVAEKPGETMTVSIDDVDAKNWFGVIPPDLSVISRSRGLDWLYTYMLSFYLEEKRRPWGVNNTVFKEVGMPHVLWELQGWQKPVYKTITDDDGKQHEVIDRLELIGKEKMSQEEHDKKVADYRGHVRDLVNFLEYLGEPAKLQRIQIGMYVMAFLFVFFVLAYLLKKEYWRDIR
ncbi:MAG: cytochrome c1 [Gammaproteobacteria bacterium]|nr:cytochrome c1 [Gammaproteobacteria bacterium]